MKSVLLGILAALVGCAIFFACLVGWYELTGQGSGVFLRRSDTEAAETTAAPDAGAGVTIVSSGTSAGESEAPAAENNANTTVPLVVIPEDVITDAQEASSGASASGADSAQNADAAASQTTETPEHLLDAFAKKIEQELSTGLDDGGHVRVARSPRGITITLWEDDLVSRLAAGQTNGETGILWEEMKDRLRTLTLTYYSRRSEEGVPDAHIVANLLNEQQQDDIILSYEDGALIHDGLDHD
ncbi:MAG: hypothetical protein II868_00390 [Butyrivibrio sp.]|nr:hypothetical protein [Butyrivibrio sp.]